MLEAGDYLVFEEVLGPRTGAKPDADPAHRQLVRIEEVAELTDPLYDADAGRRRPADPPDRPPGAAAAARALAPRGRAPLPALPLLPPVRRHARQERLGRARQHRPRRPRPHAGGGLRVRTRSPSTAGCSSTGAPLTMEARPDQVSYDASGRLLDRADRPRPATPRTVWPAVALLVTTPVDIDQWQAGSGPARELALRPALRGRGRRRRPRESALRRCRVRRASSATSSRCRPSTESGNGRAGNVGAEAIAHAAPTLAADLDRPDPEPARRPRRRRRRRRSRRSASSRRRRSTPSSSAPSPRTTGQRRPAACPTCRAPSPPTAGPAAGTRSSSRSTRATAPTSSTCRTAARRLEPAFEQRVRAFLTRFRLAGYDVELRPPRFVPLDIELEVCAAHGHFRTDVVNAVRRALSAQVLPGRHARLLPPGELHVRRAALPQPPVRGGRAGRGRRLGGRPPVPALRLRGRSRRARAAACSPIAPWEIVRLDNDPSFVEHGVLERRRQGRQGMSCTCGCCEPLASADAAGGREPPGAVGDRVPDRHVRELPRVDAGGDRLARPSWRR